MSINAYKRTISETEAPRDLERRILSLVTFELERYAEEFDAAETGAAKLTLLADGLRETLWQNERIWIAFKADLAESGNALSPELRAGLISLAFWVENHTKKVMKGTKTIKPLITMNRSIIRGMEGNQLHVAD